LLIEPSFNTPSREINEFSPNLDQTDDVVKVQHNTDKLCDNLELVYGTLDDLKVKKINFLSKPQKVKS
jgi:hypothetical protein